MAAERRHDRLSRAMLALLRRIFRGCLGRPVNRWSRQMTPAEAIDLHAALAAHGVDEDESRGGTPRRAGAAR